MKLPKKFSVKTWYRIGFVFVLAATFLAFYEFYSQAANYLRSKNAPQKQVAQQQPFPAPEFFRFVPPPQQLHLYEVFTMNRALAKPAAAEGSGKISGFDILGVVKRDRLFLVVRTKPSGKIRLIAQGEEVNSESTVKELTTSSVVIRRKGGEEKTHKIFAFTGVKEQTNKKQTQSNQGRSF